jgi:hypothetical protein
VIPFDIEVPYRMRPNMRPLSDSEPITYQDDQYDDYIDQKKKLCSPIFGNNVTEELHENILNYLKCNDFSEATKKYQEDFVIWAPNADGKLSMQIASVCFPSGWDPAEKINKTFAEIHQPVADNKLIMSAADSIATMITQKGPFVRSVWTVSNTPNLNQRPSVKKPWSNETVHQMYYRAERQVTIPLGDKAIFFIRTHILPLLSTDCDRIRISINSMTDEILAYKGLQYVKEQLNVENMGACSGY